MFKTDPLTISRIYRILKSVDADGLIGATDDNIMSVSILSTINNNLIDNLLTIISDNINNKSIEHKISMLTEYFDLIYKLYNQYNHEIELRKNFVVDMGIWKEDENQDKQDKLYKSDYYLDMYRTLSENNINPEYLDLYEAMILTEDIICNNIKESIYQMLGILESYNKSFCLVIKNLLKYANFSAFVLDIFNDVEKMYEEKVNKDDKH